MKIAITGHKRGIGQEFYKQLGVMGHQLVGISRSDGENIMRTMHTASLIEPCDMLINNATSMYAQTELLFEIWHRWQSSEDTHHIWNISTAVCGWDVDREIEGLTMRESMQYRNRKTSLELAYKQLQAQPSKIKMKLIRPKSVKTQEFINSPDSVTAEEYVRAVLKDHYAETLE